MHPSHSGPGRALVYAADRTDPIELAAELRTVPCGSRSFEVPRYEHAEPGRGGGAPAVLCIAGGGSSGAVFARLVERGAARGVRVVAFDFPGHTPEGLLGERTPPRSLLRHATPRVRARIVAALVRELAQQSPGGRVQLVAHSAGLLDAAALAGELRRRVARFVLLGTGVPSFLMMWRAQRSAARHGLASRASLREILQSRALPTGHAALHFGAREARAVDDVLLSPYQGDEHVAVVAKLFATRSLVPRRWAGASVELVASAGDRIAPPAAMHELEAWLRGRGAHVRLHVIEGPLPHMFMMFESGAERVADLLAAPIVD